MVIGDAADDTMVGDWAIGVLTLLLTAWVCWVTEPEAPSQVLQRSDESKVVRGTDVPSDHGSCSLAENR